MTKGGARHGGAPRRVGLMNGRIFFCIFGFYFFAIYFIFFRFSQNADFYFERFLPCRSPQTPVCPWCKPPQNAAK